MILGGLILVLIIVAGINKAESVAGLNHSDDSSG